MSNKWSYFDLSSFSAARLNPKSNIDEIKDYSFVLACYGSGTSSGAVTTSLGLSWKDPSTGSGIQNAVSISNPSTFTTAAPNTLTVSLTTKRFNTAGMKAFYTFSISSTISLT